MFRVLKSTFLLALLTTSLNVSAQSIPGIAEPVTFQVSPQFPQPNATITVSAQSFSTDLNRAEFTWTVNGKVFKKGTGITDISIPSGKAGSTTKVSINVKTIDIGSFSNETSIRPAEITLLSQTDGFVPPFYKAKAMEAYGSSFRVVAIPEFFTSAGKRIDPKTLVYTWQKNDSVDGTQSGYGKDTFIGSQSSYVRGGDTISVEVSTAAHDIGASKTITLSPTVAEVLFYENSPLYGIVYEKALGNAFNLPSEEVTLRAEVYNISANPSSGLMTFDWTMNGDNVTSFKNKNQITLRSTGSVRGESLVNLLVQHTQKVLQGGQASITILQ